MPPGNLGAAREKREFHTIFDLQSGNDEKFPNRRATRSPRPYRRGACEKVKKDNSMCLSLEISIADFQRVWYLPMPRGHRDNFDDRVPQATTTRDAKEGIAPVLTGDDAEAEGQIV